MKNKTKFVKLMNSYARKLAIAKAKKMEYLNVTMDKDYDILFTEEYKKSYKLLYEMACEDAEYFHKRLEENRRLFNGGNDD